MFKKLLFVLLISNAIIISHPPFFPFEDVEDESIPEVLDLSMVGSDLE